MPGRLGKARGWCARFNVKEKRIVIISEVARNRQWERLTRSAPAKVLAFKAVRLARHNAAVAKDGDTEHEVTQFRLVDQRAKLLRSRPQRTRKR